jgi:hypothetical protein
MTPRAISLLCVGAISGLMYSVAEAAEISPSSAAVASAAVATNPPVQSSFALDPSVSLRGGVPQRPIFIQPPEICSYDVNRQNPSGPLVTMPKVVLSFWDNHFWYKGQNLTDLNYYVQALEAFGNDSSFWKRLSEYSITSGSFLGTARAPSNIGGVGTLTEQQIQDEIGYLFNVASQKQFQNEILVVLLPSEIQSEYDIKNGFLGHHQTFNYKGKNVWYGVVEYSTSTSQTLSVITHEIYETATDPDLRSGYFDRAQNGEGEIGDFCNLMQEPFDGYPVQLVWSQSSCSCK